MRRVVVTGMGVVSSLGNDVKTVTDSLRQGKSGISFQPAYQEQGLRSQVAGSIDIDLTGISRKDKRFMGPGPAYAYLAMEQAVADAGLRPEQVSHPRVGLVASAGGMATSSLVKAVDLLRTKGVRKVGPFRVPQVMASSVSACLATAFKIKGASYSLASACATSIHSIGHGAELIQMDKQDIVFAGGGEEEHWSLTMLFDAMGALTTHFNHRPQQASRPYDRDRDGFVIAGGGAVLVLEELSHAQARGATIYAEIVGYGATSDGHDMVAPNGEGAVCCMQQALTKVQRPIDYINTHGTSTPIGDPVELAAIKEVFGGKLPPISSTKSLSGHSLGAVGAQETIFCILMMQQGFIAGSANIEQLDDKCAGYPIVSSCRDNVNLERVLTNSFGFGGTNASLVLEKYFAD